MKAVASALRAAHYKKINMNGERQYKGILNEQQDGHEKKKAAVRVKASLLIADCCFSCLFAITVV